MDDFEDQNQAQSFFNLTEIISKYRYPLLILLVGLLLVGFGVLYLKGGVSGILGDSGKVEVLSASSSTSPEESGQKIQELVVEVSGAVENPGVYKMQAGARIDDVLEKAGGVTKEADGEWMAKSLNRAAKVTDGQKLYIPTKTSGVKTPVNGSRTINFDTSNGLTNINSASASELDKLPGIGPTYAQKIIDQRPYSKMEELVEKKVLPKSTFEKIKDKISIY